MNFYSDDRQDEFVANLFNFKRDGSFVDIGSGASVGSNNTYALEKELCWRGICIERDPVFNESYKQRTCNYHNEDALLIDYKDLFSRYHFPAAIDYLSLDVDEASLHVLRLLPLSSYCFKVITIEHDSHVHGDLYRQPQRDFLAAKGYYLLCADVLNQSGRNIGQEHAWEDWWVHPGFFSMETMVKLQSERLNTEQIMQKFI